MSWCQIGTFFLWIATSIGDAAAVNLNGIKRLLANGLSLFPIKGNPVFNNGPKCLFNNGPKCLSKNSPDCPILRNSVFDNFILAEQLLAKALQSFETCVL